MFHALGSIASVVFPIFASYRAIKSHDMTYATPWLKFWVVMGIEQALENTFGVVLSVLPLYSLARLLFFAWLVLPQSQGAVRLYDEKVEPFLDRYNSQIEDFFANGHTYVRDYGLQYLSILMKWLTGKGFETETKAAAPTPAPPQTYMDSVMGYLKSSGPATGKITRLFDMYRAAQVSGVSREVSSETVDIPSSLPHAEQLGLIDKERTRLLAALSSLDARGSLLKSDKSNTSLSSGVNISAADFSPVLASSDTEFDVVKTEDVLGLDERPNSRGWFWQRHYAKEAEKDKGKGPYEKLRDEPSAPTPAAPVHPEEEPLIPN
ncbi:HVA22-like protein b [Yarrowia sp. B02]|nr:HVA22-like protein b [Yarrowia sp. B02]